MLSINYYIRRAFTRSTSPISAPTENAFFEMAAATTSFDSQVEAARRLIRTAGTAEADRIRSVAESLAAEVEARADRLAEAI